MKLLSKRALSNASKWSSFTSRKRKLRRRSTLGLEPGTLVSSQESYPTEIECIRYDRKEHEVLKIDNVDSLRRIVRESKEAPLSIDSKSGQPTTEREVTYWINIVGLKDTKLIKQIGDMLGIHPLALEDVVNVHQRAKFEEYGDVLFFVVRMPSTETSFETEQFSIFLADNVALTVQERPGDCLAPLRKRISSGTGRLRNDSADYLVYAIIDTIIDGYFSILETYVRSLESIAPQLTTASDRNLPLQLHEIRGNLLAMRSVIRQQRDALHHLLMEPHNAISPDTLLYFRDCLDHINQLMDSMDAERETCAELRELYFALLGQRNNDVIKVLTIVSTIFIPMSFIAGVYGMNFDPDASPWNMPELRWIFGYPVAIGAMATVAFSLLWYLKSKGWLD